MSTRTGLGARARLAAGAAAIGLAACGGGGGGSEGAAPAPVVRATISAAKVAVGAEVVIEWSSEHARGCAIPELGTDALAAQGTRRVVAGAGGRFTYTVTCTGEGGSAAQALALVVPLPVQRSSYLNAKHHGLEPRPLPLGGNARGFADFEQAGRLSYVVHSLDYSPPDATRGKVRLFRLHDDGSSTEITADLIDGDNTGCLHPRKALVADFNGDARPDVFFACHGWDSADAPPPGTGWGEFPVMLLSQPDGRYRVKRTTYDYTGPRAPYLHGATAIDLDGSGRAHVVVADVNANEHCESPLYVLRNRGDGSFVRDTSQFAALANANGLCQGTAVWSAEILDLDGDGRPELWAAGQDNPTGEAFGGLQSQAWRMTGDMVFEAAPAWTFPAQAAAATPLDITVHGAFAYFVRVPPAYDRYLVEEVDLRTMAGRVVFTNTTDFGSLAATRPECMGYGGAWVDFLHASAAGLLVTDDSCRSPNLPTAR